MNLNKTYPNRQALWQALPPRQRQRLLALVGEWALRRWKAQWISSPLPATSKGGRNEPGER